LKYCQSILFFFAPLSKVKWPFFLASSSRYGPRRGGKSGLLKSTEARKETLGELASLARELMETEEAFYRFVQGEYTK